MSAPSHHLRQDVCSTRPAYRDGRQPKAVKVYTVAQESSYLLIQGVPAVGAHDDLNKLCSSFGTLESFHPLDDYACEEFTEVYLVHFERIQSARYAKRKLDDTSFFGGVLHVCYAPEYESVEETRDKLQDRRRQVAGKIRQHEKGSHKSKIEELESQLAELEGRTSHPQGETSQSSERLDPGLNRVPPFHSENSGFPTFSSVDSGNFQNLGTDSIELSDQPRVHNSTEISTLDYSIPLPPQHGVHPHYAPRHQHGYDYANVPSSHATLPQNFDERLKDNNAKTEKIEDDKKFVKGEAASNIDKLNESKKSVSGLIIKDYKSHHPVPKFVPRQAVKKNDTQVTKERVTDESNKEIRRNAFTLGDQQGPDKPEHLKSQTLDIPQETVISVNMTRKEIRKQVSKFSSEPPIKRKKTK